MRTAITHTLHATLERWFPEKRLFLKSEDVTRFIRLGPGAQMVIWAVGVSVTGWLILATAIILMDSIGSGNFRAQAERDRSIYEDRLNQLSEERDRRAVEAAQAQARFAAALEQVSAMQTELLASENRRREMETGIEVIQSTLRDTMVDRQSLADQLARLNGAATDSDGATPEARAEALQGTVSVLADALAQTAEERDSIQDEAEEAMAQADALALDMRLMEERNDEIFRQLEDALTVSVEPLDNMFRAAGMDPEALIDQVRTGYSGIGGPLVPIQFSTMGMSVPDADTLRANTILASLDRINMYRIASEGLPLVVPVRANFRYTSPYGRRWGKMHEGVDFAASVGTPVYAPADGVVTFAAWSSGYGRLIKIRHDYGIETRYAHLNAIRVQVGQRVSRGDRIGDIGNSGRSTGPHLHYEIRVGGKSIDPMVYIRAGRNVF